MGILKSSFGDPVMPPPKIIQAGRPAVFRVSNEKARYNLHAISVLAEDKHWKPSNAVENGLAVT
jgi:hypothetical protein